jgi:hypothetical protein
MKIESVSLKSEGESGNLVTVGFRWGCNERFDFQDIGGVLAWLQLNGLCGDGVCAPPLKISPEASAAVVKILNEGNDALVELDKAEASTGRRRKSHANPLEASAAPLADASAAVDGGSTTSQQPSPTEGAAGSRRRRSAPTADAEKEPATATDTSSEDGAPLARRQRRAVPAAELTPETPASTETTAASPEPRMRQRRAAASVDGTAHTEAAQDQPAPTATPSPPVAPSDSSGISNEDLAKAASQAAAVITPKVVKEFLLEFHGATSVGELVDEERREFIDELRVMVSEAQ